MAVWISSRPEVHTDFLDSDKQECHITLSYLGDADFEKVRDHLRATAHPKEFNREIRGIGTWTVPGKGYVLYASVFDLEFELLEWYFGLRACVRMCGVEPDNSFPFNPHITLAWSEEPFTNIPILKEPIPITLNNLYISEDNYHEEVWSL